MSVRGFPIALNSKNPLRASCCAAKVGTFLEGYTDEQTRRSGLRLSVFNTEIAEIAAIGVVVARLDGGRMNF